MEKSTKLLHVIDTFLSKSNIKSSHFFSFRFSFYRSLLHYVFLRKVTGTKVQRETCKSLQDDRCKYSLKWGWHDVYYKYKILFNRRQTFMTSHIKNIAVNQRLNPLRPLINKHAKTSLYTSINYRLIVY